MSSCHQSWSMPGPFAKYAVKGANSDQLLNSSLVEMGQIANHFEPKLASIDSRGCRLKQGGEIGRGWGEDVSIFVFFKPQHHDFWIEL